MFASPRLLLILIVTFMTSSSAFPLGQSIWDRLIARGNRIVSATTGTGAEAGVVAYPAAAAARAPADELVALPATTTTTVANSASFPTPSPRLLPSLPLRASKTPSSQSLASSTTHQPPTPTTSSPTTTPTTDMTMMVTSAPNIASIFGEAVERSLRQKEHMWDWWLTGNTSPPAVNPMGVLQWTTTEWRVRMSEAGLWDPHATCWFDWGFRVCWPRTKTA